MDNTSSAAIRKLMNDGVVDRIDSPVLEGKESRVFHGWDAEGNELAIKVHMSKIFRGVKKKRYLFGDWRYRHAKRKIILRTDFMWAEKEFRNLVRMEKAGVKAPSPLGLCDNVLVMTFIGKSGIPAPHLDRASDVNLSDIYRKILHNLLLMISEARLVHGDLSPYNILISEGEPFFIDVSQTTLFDHPLALGMLKGDIANVNAFFEAKGITTTPSAALLSELSQFLVVGKPVDRYGRKYPRGARYRS